MFLSLLYEKFALLFPFFFIFRVCFVPWSSLVRVYSFFFPHINYVCGSLGLYFVENMDFCQNLGLGGQIIELRNFANGK